MAKLSFTEKRLLEDVLGMGGGYVLSFSNNELQDIVRDSIGINIYAERYAGKGESKANRLRCLWEKEPDHQVGKLIHDFITFLDMQMGDSAWVDQSEYRKWDQCLDIAKRLRRAPVVESLDELQPNVSEEDFDILVRSIKDDIERDEAHATIDRLHTYCMKYVRAICKKHGIEFKQEEPLNSLFAKYIKNLQTSGVIEAKISLRIMKSTIDILSDLNDARNNLSFAHANKLLAREEALFIVNNIANLIRFTTFLERPTP